MAKLALVGYACSPIAFRTCQGRRRRAGRGVSPLPITLPKERPSQVLHPLLGGLLHPLASEGETRGWPRGCSALGELPSFAPAVLESHTRRIYPQVAPPVGASCAAIAVHQPREVRTTPSSDSTLLRGTSVCNVPQRLVRPLLQGLCCVPPGCDSLCPHRVINFVKVVQRDFFLDAEKHIFTLRLSLSLSLVGSNMSDKREQALLTFKPVTLFRTLHPRHVDERQAKAR